MTFFESKYFLSDNLVEFECLQRFSVARQYSPCVREYALQNSGSSSDIGRGGFGPDPSEAQAAQLRDELCACACCEYPKDGDNNTAMPGRTA